MTPKLMLGWPATGNGTSTFALSAALGASWLAMSFVPSKTKQLSTVRAFISALSGTLAGTDITADIYDATGASGAPVNQLESGKTPTATITASNWYTWSGFTKQYTGTTMYNVIFKNVNGTPTTNFCTFKGCGAFSGGPANLLIGSSSNEQSYRWFTSTNSGGTWASGSQINALRIGYTDGSFEGMTVSTNQNSDAVYQARESGVKFTYSGAPLRVAGIGMQQVGANGTPTGIPRYGLWQGNQVSYTSYGGTTTAGLMYPMYFASPVILFPGTVRITLSDTLSNSDSAANSYRLNEFIWDTDSNSLSLLPWQGTAQKTLFNGTSWGDTQGTIVSHALLLDPAQEFQQSGTILFG